MHQVFTFLLNYCFFSVHRFSYKVFRDFIDFVDSVRRVCCKFFVHSIDCVCIFVKPVVKYL